MGTGMFDKSGREILEGDIINHPTKGTGRIVRLGDGFGVKWNDEQAN